MGDALHWKDRALARVVDSSADDRWVPELEVRLRFLRRLLPCSYAEIVEARPDWYGGGRDSAGASRLTRDLAALPARMAYGWWFEKKELFQSHG